MKNKIMELADAVVNASHGYGTECTYEARGALLNEVSRVESLAETLKIEAQSHAQEARTANATITAIYQACTGATGEPGNWHGAQPVIDKIAAMQSELEAAKADAERMKHLVANVRCAGANIDGQHAWNFMLGRGWATGASFREAVDNAMKGQP